MVSQESIGKALEVINSGVGRVAQDPNVRAGIDRVFPGIDPTFIFLITITTVIMLGLLLGTRR